MGSKNKIIITGASSGIGQATALCLAQSGDAQKIWLLARREDRLQSLAKKIEKMGVEAVVAPLDIRQEKSVKNFIAADADLKNANVLINNAGLAKGLSTLQAGDTADWEQMLDTNVKGLLYITRQILPLMIQNKKGHIVNIGSVAGHTVYPNGAVYCATKHAVRALNAAMRIDALGTGVRFTSIDPGMLETEFSLVRFNGDAEKAKAVYAGMQPLQPEDIAEAIRWCLAQPQHVNVQEILLMPTDQASVRDVHRRVNP